MLIAVWLKFEESNYQVLIIQDILFIVGHFQEKIQPQDIGWKKTPTLFSLVRITDMVPTMIGVGIIGYYASNIPGFQAQPS